MQLIDIWPKKVQLDTYKCSQPKEEYWQRNSRPLPFCQYNTIVLIQKYIKCITSEHPIQIHLFI